MSSLIFAAYVPNPGISELWLQLGSPTPDLVQELTQESGPGPPASEPWVLTASRAFSPQRIGYHQGRQRCCGPRLRASGLPLGAPALPPMWHSVFPMSPGPSFPWVFGDLEFIAWGRGETLQIWILKMVLLFILSFKLLDWSGGYCLFLVWSMFFFDTRLSPLHSNELYAGWCLRRESRRHTAHPEFQLHPILWPDYLSTVLMGPQHKPLRSGKWGHWMTVWRHSTRLFPNVFSLDGNIFH